MLSSSHRFDHGQELSLIPAVTMGRPPASSLGNSNEYSAHPQAYSDRPPSHAISPLAMP